MKRRNLVHSVFLVIALPVAWVGAANAHLGDNVYPIYELPTSDLPDLHDGTLEDWEEVLPDASLDHNDFQRNNAGITGTVDPDDLAFRIFLAWHSASQRIYIAVERIDDVYLDPGEGGAMLAIDGDHSGGQYWFLGEDEESRRLNESQAQDYGVWLDGEGGRLSQSWPWIWTAEPRPGPCHHSGLVILWCCSESRTPRSPAGTPAPGRPA